MSTFFSLRTALSRSNRLGPLPVLRNSRGVISPNSLRCGPTYTTASAGQTGSRTIKASYAVVAAILLGTTSYVAGALAPPFVFQLLNPRLAPAPVPEYSEEGRIEIERIENELQNLKLVKQCREAKDADEWYEARPYIQLPRERLVNNFTAGALRGPGKLAVPPLIRARNDESEAWVFIHLGRGICGHEGVVHGGLLATLLDEGCGRIAALNVPSNVAVTANLNLDFKAPTLADQFVVMKSKLVELKGRKIVAESRIETLDGNVLVQAKAIFIEPKLAKVISSPIVQVIYPSAKTRMEKMTGANVADEGAVKVQ